MWGKGHATLGELNFDTAAYTARYCTKKINGKSAEAHYTTTCPTTGNIILLQKEYASMSLKPGIAGAWLEKYQTDAYPSDYLIHKAKKITIPRYFDNIYERTPGNNLEEIKLNRKQNARKWLKENTPERLKTREQHKQLTYNQLTRNYENGT